jgi:hypothetical protein
MVVVIKSGGIRRPATTQSFVLPTDHLIPLRNGPALAGRLLGLYSLQRKLRKTVAEILAVFCEADEFAHGPSVVGSLAARGVDRC